jgi:hypothetical protein
MNSTNQLKQIVKEEVVKVKLDNLREHVQLAQQERSKNLIKEFYIEKKSTSDPNFVGSNGRTWSDEGKSAAERVLTQLGARRMDLGSNTYGYELDADILSYPEGSEELSRTGKKDRLWFYHYDEMWSTNHTRNLGWKLGYSDPEADKEANIMVDPGDFADGAANVIVLYASRDDAKAKNRKARQGVLYKSTLAGDVAINVSEKPEIYTPEDELLDQVQTVMDFAGMIPVIGDAIDAINAIIYGWRGKYIDMALSLIGIIPMIGSAIAIPLRAATKGAKGMRYAKTMKRAFAADDLRKAGKAISGRQAKHIEQFHELLRRDDLIPAELLDQLPKAMGVLGGTISSAANGIRKIPVDQMDDFAKVMDKYAEMLKMHEQLGSGVTKKLGKAPGFDPKDAEKTMDVLKGAEKAGAKIGAKTAKRLPRLLNIMTLGLLPKLRKAAWFPAKKINRIARGLERKFVKEFAGDPKRMMALIKMQPGKYAKNISKLNKKLGPDAIAHLNKSLAKQLPVGSTVKSMGDFAKNVDKMSSKEIMHFFDAIKSMPAGQGYLKAFGDDLARLSMNKNNPAWNLYANNSMKNFAASQSKIGMKSTDFLKLENSFAKNLDIIWNEMQDIASDLGLKKNDDAEGVIYHLTKESVKYAMPDFTADIAANAPKLGKMAGDTTKQIVSVTTGGYINPNEWEHYDPEDEAGGDYA